MNDRGALRVSVAETSASFFQLLGVNTVAGGTFAATEDLSGRNHVAVISYGLWQQLFAGDPNLAGKSLRLDGLLFAVAGVAPATFDYPGKTSIWLPTAFETQMSRRGAFDFRTIGRLKEISPLVLLRSFMKRRWRAPKCRSMAI